MRVPLLLKNDETLTQLSGATTFSKLDANSGFWQVPLSKSYKLLTIFITQFGRHCYNKLLFGISSAPEHFQRCMSSLLGDLPRVICVIDDILTFGQSQPQDFTQSWSVFTQQGLLLTVANANMARTSLSSLDMLLHKLDVQVKLRQSTEWKHPNQFWNHSNS